MVWLKISEPLFENMIELRWGIMVTVVMGVVGMCGEEHDHSCLDLHH